MTQSSYFTTLTSVKNEQMVPGSSIRKKLNDQRGGVAKCSKLSQPMDILITYKMCVGCRYILAQILGIITD